MKLSQRVVSYLQVAPLALVMLVFLGIPVVMILTVSFFDYDEFDLIPKLC